MTIRPWGSLRDEVDCAHLETFLEHSIKTKNIILVSFAWHLLFFPLYLSRTHAHYASSRFSFLWSMKVQGGDGFNSTFFIFFNHGLFVCLFLSLFACRWDFWAFEAWGCKEEVELNCNSFCSSTTSNSSSLSANVYWLMSCIVSFICYAFSTSLGLKVISILSLFFFSNSFLVAATKFSFVTTTLVSH